jgi:hypothetical protein
MSGGLFAAETGFLVYLCRYSKLFSNILTATTFPSGNCSYTSFPATNISSHHLVGSWTCVGPWKGSVCGPCEWERHLGKGGTGSSERGQGASVDSGQRKRKDVIRGEMRRRREDKEDDPFTASKCQHAQSKSMCTAGRWKVNPLLMYIFAYLLYLFFQENKSFGVRTICIHPLM